MAKESKDFKERRLVAFTHMENYLQTFIQRWNTPTERLTALSAGLEEVSQIRMVLFANRMEGLPHIRKTYRRNKS